MRSMATYLRFAEIDRYLARDLYQRVLEIQHRLYDGDDVARLYRICLLRRLGFALPRIGEVLDDHPP